MDRNTLDSGFSRCARLVSLSARRAWIEIPIVPIELTKLVKVALRKESVDRNVRYSRQFGR